MSEAVKAKNRSFVVEINQEWCKGCYICVDVCPVEGIFHIEEEVSDKGFRRVGAVNLERCTGCMLCELLCPDLAVFVKDI
ncbi:MAG: 4Fe-4S binding protein [candidate division Zixibacteria bacterium]|nr:4Fe-4S binding protein [Candidatus Tariuqbacter arcticus]